MAARWPAVRASRLPTLAALQSRITRPPRRVRTTIGGVATVGSGGAVLAYGASADAEVPIVAGTLLIVAGVAMLHRLLVDLVARLASGAPLALRFAARDASRQASRTGPAVVASMLTLAPTASHDHHAAKPLTDDGASGSSSCASRAEADSVVVAVR